jgi:hypothetical protein
VTKIAVANSVTELTMERAMIGSTSITGAPDSDFAAWSPVDACNIHRMSVRIAQYTSDNMTEPWPPRSFLQP